MKYYPTLVITGKELSQAGVKNIHFSKGKLTDPTIIEDIEDYCGRPIIMIYPSPVGKNEIIAFIADGYVQYNRITDARTVVLKGNYDTLKVILTDMIEQRPNESPINIFDHYAYQTDVATQYRLKNWIEETYEV